jgi:hypothetical protein
VLGARTGIMTQTLENEEVQAVAGQRGVGTGRFKNHERFSAERAAMFEGAIERKIVSQAAAGDHPVKHVARSAAEGSVVADSNATGGNRGHRAILDFHERQESKAGDPLRLAERVASRKAIQRILDIFWRRAIVCVPGDESGLGEK